MRLQRGIHRGRVFKRVSRPVPLPTLPQQEGAGLQKLRVRGVSCSSLPPRCSREATQPLRRQKPPPEASPPQVLGALLVALGLCGQRLSVLCPWKSLQASFCGPRMSPTASPRGPPARGRAQHLHRGPVGCWVPPHRVLSHQASSICRRSKVAQLTAPEPKCCYRAMGAQQRCSLAWEDRLLPGASQNGGRWARQCSGYSQRGQLSSKCCEWPDPAAWARGSACGREASGRRMARGASAWQRLPLLLGVLWGHQAWRILGCSGRMDTGLEKEASRALRCNDACSGTVFSSPRGPLPPPIAQGRPGCPRCTGISPSTAALPSTSQRPALLVTLLGSGVQLSYPVGSG